MPLFGFKKDKIGSPAVMAAPAENLPENDIPDIPQGKQLISIPVAMIRPNPNQPRRTFDEDAIAELAASISQVGLIQPLVVRRVGTGYELIAGERRLRAVKRLGMDAVPCIVDGSLDDTDSALMAIIENLQRENLHFFEEAECYAALLSKLNTTQDDLASRLGKSQGFIANKLRLLRFSREIRGLIESSRLSERHARALLRLNDDSSRADAVKRITDGSLSVKDTEKLVDSMLNSEFDAGKKGAKPRPRIVRLVKDYRLFINSVNTACEQLRSAGMGVDVSQVDREDGVDITIRITRE